jgi:type I restriction enzyme, S subunit
LSELPRGWAWAKLGELGRWFGGGTPSKAVASYWSGEIPWVSPKDMKIERVIDAVDHISAVAVEESATTLVPAGTVLVVTRSGILRHTLPVAVTEREVALNQDLKALILANGADPNYVAWALRSNAQAILRECSKAGTTVANIETARLLSFRVPLAPLAEQRRIVTAIEEQLSRLDAAERWMTAVARRLDVVRRVALIQRLQSNSWPKVRLAEVGDGTRHALAIGPFGSNLKVSDYQETGVPLVFVRNVRAREFGGAGTRYVSHQKAKELAAHRIRGGDVLITKMGDPPGDAAVYPQAAPEAIITADCIKISVGAGFEPEFIAFAIEAPEQRRQVLAATKGVAQKKVSLGRFKEVTIPAPPLKEQRLIAEELNRLFPVLQAQHVALDEVRRKARALRGSILAAGFRGELVSQDPSDEPASVLLHRITAEVAPAPKPSRKRKETTPA